MHKKQILLTMYILNFLLAFSIALPTYINSTFLRVYTTEKFVGIIFTVGSLLTLLSFINISKVLKKLGSFKMAILLTLLQILFLVGLTTANTLLIIAPVFAIYIATTPLLRFNLDIFLEHYSTDEETGKIRGMFFTSGNVAWVTAPAITGLILTNGDYWKIYMMSAMFMLVILAILGIRLKKFEDPKYHNVKFTETLRQIKKRPNIVRVFIADFLLRFFYVWMIIYMPIYLHEYIGFAWDKIGFMFTIMLLPFLLFQFPAGKLADTKYGEKEFLVFGFIAMTITVAILPFITSVNFWVWAGALFATRVGASIVEIMTDTYFFKKTDSSDTNILSAFRNIRSIAYIVAPLIASVFLLFFELKYLFVTLGVIMLVGIKYSLSIKDTL